MIKKIHGVSVAVLKSVDDGISYAKEFLYKNVGKDTVLFLSGGSTPKALYQQLAHEAKLTVGAVAIVDERYGEPMHRISNELSVKNSGLLSYLEVKGIPFSLILKPGKSREEVALEYEKTVKTLFGTFPKRVALLGVGEDGHTAGIAPNRPDFKNPLFEPENRELWVGEFKDPKPMSEDGSPVPPNGFGQRVTLTIKALSQMDSLLVLAFSEKKKKAIEMVLTDGKIEEAPLRFCLDSRISQKTLFITDQKV